MFGGNRKARRPIGVAVTQTEVRLAQAGPSPTGRALTAAARAPLPAAARPGEPGYDRHLAEAIGVALRRGPFVGKLSVSAMPAEAMHYKNVRLPKMPEYELAQAVAWEAKERVALGEPASVQFYHAGEVRQGQDARCEVVLLAAKQSAVDAHLRGLTGAGLTPLAIDATGGALARLTVRDDTTTFTVHAEHRSLEVVIARGGRVLLDKLLPVGDAGLDGADADELAREVGLCLRYHSVTFRGERPDGLAFVGEPVPEPLRNAVVAVLGLPVLEAPAVLSAPATAGEASPGLWAVAAGLSMRDTATNQQRGAA